MSPLGILLVIILIIVLFGGVGGPYFGAPWPRTYGYGGAGLVIIILLVLLLTGYLR